MSSGITITIQDAEVKQLLAAVSARYSTMSPVMRDISETMVKRVRNRFDTETDPDGNKWLPTKVLSNYLGYVGTRKGYTRKAAYTKKGGVRAAFARYLESKKILVLTGALRDNIRPQHSATTAEWGTSGNEKYAAVHQFGGPAGRGLKIKIPARPYLGRNVGTNMEIAPGDKQAAIEMITEHLNAPLT